MTISRKQALAPLLDALVTAALQLPIQGSLPSPQRVLGQAAM